MRTAWLGVLVSASLACPSPGERRAEEVYAPRVIEILSRFETSFGDVAAACDRGQLECAAAAHRGAGVARRARSDLAALAPPRKLRDAHERLLAGLDHLAEGFDVVADTYWNRSDAFGATVRATRAIEAAVRDIGAAGRIIGFRGERRFWTARR